jgi:hypothetical protein
MYLRFKQSLSTNNREVPTVFVDFSKAFDCVNHKLLVKKLILEFNLSSDSVLILYEYETT